ncbi:MAG: EF-hand domain-containing protein [Woeseiaceae bacterium]|nr:EF-hand domain-containing protein [Woeseiaceae bacterium]
MGDARNNPDAKLRSVFRQFDANGDGLINESEFNEMLVRLGWVSTVEVLSLEFSAIDGNDDGKVEYREFADWWQDRN